MQGDSSEAESIGGAGSDETAIYDRGFSWVEGDPGSLQEIVEIAFDYRGDVTLLLRDGDDLVGYLANRSICRQVPAESWIEVFPAAGGPRRRISLVAIRGLILSGKDVASGKSWENWLKKYTERRDALARGEDVENIDLFPDEMD
ncbi:MAG: hypothetical protein CMJ97_05545 [Planctomycetes bacterium]|nr:hypothetical protein [Planctomycetota bacterium]